MRELEGSGIVHYPDYRFNDMVIRTIKNAKLRDKRAYLDIVKGAKTEEELEPAEWVFPKLEGYQEEREEEER